MRVIERRDRILQMVKRQERVTVDGLVDELGISRETIRRDLKDLATRGMVRKFHGGATLVTASAPEDVGEGTFQARVGENVERKVAIARAAAALFASGDTLFVDTGSTTVLFAEEVARVHGLTIITNSVAIAQVISRGVGGGKVFLLGGEFSDEASETLGSLVQAQIAQFHAAHAVLTVGAVTTRGVMDYNMQETEVARAMVAQAQRVTVLADSSKLTKAGLFQVCPLSEIDCLVVDNPPEAAIGQALEEAEVRVVVAERPAASNGNAMSHGSLGRAASGT